MTMDSLRYVNSLTTISMSLCLTYTLFLPLSQLDDGGEGKYGSLEDEKTEGKSGIDMVGARHPYHIPFIHHNLQDQIDRFYCGYFTSALTLLGIDSDVTQNSVTRTEPTNNILFIVGANYVQVPPSERGCQVLLHKRGSARGDRDILFQQSRWVHSLSLSLSRCI
jgi:hypothetical protein